MTGGGDDRRGSSLARLPMESIRDSIRILLGEEGGLHDHRFELSVTQMGDVIHDMTGVAV